MIINGGSRGKWKRFAVHLANTKDNDGGVRLVEVRGMSAKTIKEGFAQLQAMADLAGAGNKEFYYHFNINPKEGEDLTEEQWQAAGDRTREALKLDGQPGMVIEHSKGGRTHRHYVTLRVDLETGKLISDGWNYVKHEKTARELERQFALEPVKGALVERDGPRPERRPKNWEVQRGKRTGIDPQEVKAEVTALWNECESGAAFRSALAQHGYVLAQGDRRDFCIIDPAGNEHSLARRIEGARAKDIRERMADIDRNSLPKVEGGRTERRKDKRRVAAAVDAGADRKRIEAALNASRASEIYPDGTTESMQERERRDAYETTVRHGQHDAKSPTWHERQEQRQQPEQEPER